MRTPLVIAAEPDAACRLTPAELHTRRDELIPSLFKQATSVTDIGHGLRFTFENKTGLIAELARVIEREQDCCNLLCFQLTAKSNAGTVTLDVTGPDGTADMLRRL